VHLHARSPIVTAVKNDGTPSQQIFETKMARLGKRAHLIRLRDQKDLRGLNQGRAVKAFPQPADYTLTLDGVLYYAEVKSSIDEMRWAFKFRPDQWACGKGMRAAGGGHLYLVLVHNVRANRWYWLNMNLVLEWKETQASIAWDELEKFAWT
jgi:hypothetical protein